MASTDNSEVGGLVLAIQELIDRLNGMYEERARRYEGMNRLRDSADRAQNCLRAVTDLGTSTGNIDSMWDAMQTQMINAADVWPVLHEVKLTDLEVDLYKATWNAVRAALAN